MSKLPASIKRGQWVGVVKRDLNKMTQEENKLRQFCWGPETGRQQNTSIAGVDVSSPQV